MKNDDPMKRTWEEIGKLPTEERLKEMWSAIAAGRQVEPDAIQVLSDNFELVRADHLGRARGEHARAWLVAELGRPRALISDKLATSGLYRDRFLLEVSWATRGEP